MLMSPIEPPPRPASYRIVRLIRRWAAGADLGAARLPSMMNLGRRIGVDPQATLALASVFQLTEACLGRPLEAECCCSPLLARDERAVLMMIATATPASPHQASPSIPHGLPGALHWAIASVRASMGEAVDPIAGSNKCPFAA